MDWIFFHFRQSFRTDDSVFAKTTKLPKQTRFVENRSHAEAPVGRSGLGKRYYEIITTTIIAIALKRATADLPKDVNNKFETLSHDMPMLFSILSFARGILAFGGRSCGYPDHRSSGLP
jgi:hypothetical protein